MLLILCIIDAVLKHINLSDENHVQYNGSTYSLVQLLTCLRDNLRLREMT